MLKIAIIKKTNNSETEKYSEDLRWVAGNVLNKMESHLANRKKFRRPSNKEISSFLKQSFEEMELDLRKKTTTIL